MSKAHSSTAKTVGSTSETSGNPGALSRTDPARILFFAPRSEIRSTIVDILERHNFRCSYAGDLANTLNNLKQPGRRLDVVMVYLPAGDISGFVSVFQNALPGTVCVAIAESPSAELAIQLMKYDAVDLIALPANPQDLVSRLEVAVRKARAKRDESAKLARLQISADESGPRIQSLEEELSSTRKKLRNAQDLAHLMENRGELRANMGQLLEDGELGQTVLRHLWAKLGASPMAIFFPDGYDFRLGASMKSIDSYKDESNSFDLLLECLSKTFCQKVAGERDVMLFPSKTNLCTWLEEELPPMEESFTMAFSCWADDRCQAVVVVFRPGAFGDFGRNVAEAFRPIIAQGLAQIERILYRAKPSWPDEAPSGQTDEYGFGAD